MRHLLVSVLHRGVLYPAGSPETSELAGLVPDALWLGSHVREPEAAAVGSAAVPSPGNKPSKINGEPPRQGEGSSRLVWKEYAESLGIEVPPGTGRDGIIELVSAR